MRTCCNCGDDIPAGEWYVANVTHVERESDTDSGTVEVLEAQDEYIYCRYCEAAGLPPSMRDDVALDIVNGDLIYRLVDSHKIQCISGLTDEVLLELDSENRPLTANDVFAFMAETRDW